MKVNSLKVMLKFPGMFLPSVYLMGMVSSFVVIEYYICPHIQKENSGLGDSW